MGLTKKHFERMASILRRSKNRDSIIDRVVIWFSEENPRFDQERFLKAVLEVD